MVWNHVLLGFLWTVYCVLHSVLASVSVKDFFRRMMGRTFKHYRLAYTVFAAAGLAAIVWFGLSIPTASLFQTTVFTRTAGALTAIAGLALMFVCIKKYFLNLSGLRSLAQEEVNPVLEVRGVHRFVRHPLYLGTFAFIWGLLLLYPTASLLLSNAIITVYTLIGIQLEERKLLLQFGSRYEAYQQTVPKLLPKFPSAERV